DDRNLLIFRAVDDAHGSQSCRQIVSESLRENHDAIAIKIGRILGYDHPDRTIVFINTSERRIFGKLRIVGWPGACEHDCNLPFDRWDRGILLIHKYHLAGYGTVDRPGFRYEVCADLELSFGGHCCLEAKAITRTKNRSVHVEGLEVLAIGTCWL